MGTWRSLYYFGEVDYGGPRLGPTTARLSLAFPAGRKWNLYADVDQPLAGGRNSLDIGGSRSLGGFLLGPFPNGDAHSATVGLRLWLPLGAGERSTPWLSRPVPVDGHQGRFARVKAPWDVASWHDSELRIACASKIRPV